MDEQKRKVVQVAISESHYSGALGSFAVNQTIIALCNDGTIWQSSDDTWKRLPDIPQD